MKTVSLFLALVGGAGFLYRNQVSSLVGPSHRQSAEGVYYLRSARTLDVPGGTVRWPAGRELRLAPLTTDSGDQLTLTDGHSVSRVPRAELIRDMDDAAALRKIDEADQNNVRRQAMQQRYARLAESHRAALDEIHGTALDASAAQTNRSGPVATVARAPVFYPVYQTVQTVVVERPVTVWSTVRVSAAPQYVSPPRVAPSIRYESPAGNTLPRCIPLPTPVAKRN